ncbi:hypothetical protein [Pantoea sp.]|jgi:hypothetical protein|nr:hypothetical protein [Pantoea sp.]
MSDKEMYRIAFELCEDRAMAKRMVSQMKRQINQKAREKAPVNG